MEQKRILKFTITNDGIIKMDFKQLLSTKLQYDDGKWTTITTIIKKD